MVSGTHTFRNASLTLRFNGIRLTNTQKKKRKTNVFLCCFPRVSCCHLGYRSGAGLIHCVTGPGQSVVRSARAKSALLSEPVLNALLSEQALNALPWELAMSVESPETVTNSACHKRTIWLLADAQQDGCP